jgi:hypothetical protein
MQRLPDLPSTRGWVADEGLVLIQPRRAPTNTSPFFQPPSRTSVALGARTHEYLISAMTTTARAPYGVQSGGAGSSIRRGAPTGTMKVTYVSAGSEPLFSATCTSVGSSAKP